jgi:exoribonuclease R
MILETKNYKQFRIGDISFDDYHQANHCLPGDSVSWDGQKSILEKRADHRILVGVLELNSKYLYGHTSRGVKIYLFHPLNKAYPPMRVGCSERDTSQNQLALVKFDSWNETIPRANLVRLLGPIGKWESESLGLQWLYGKPELAKMMCDSEIVTLKGRFIKENTINIDPEGCKDIDDVVTLIKREGGWELVITIADVAESILQDSPGDVLARERCQTFYQKGQAVLPMLPRELSENQLSLLPGQSRRGIALTCFWNGTQVEVKGFEEVSIQNTKSYSYETIYSADFPVSILKSIASYLKGQETNDSHEWVEELMLLYNRESAKILLTMQAGLLRTHAAADIEKLQRYESLHPDLRIYAFQSAEYELTAEGKVHATLGNLPYTHLTSPLRRYADLVNQRVLKAYLNNETVSHCSPSLPTVLNKQQKQQKKHDRDLFFLEQILEKPTGDFTGISIDTNKVYIPTWKRIIKVKDCELIPGTPVSGEYYADLKKVSWKERIVFRLH